MLFPSLTDYLSAIENAEDNFEKLSSLRPIRGADGKPLMDSGNFAVVFKMEDPQNSSVYAIRCYTKDTFTKKIGSLPIDERVRIINEEIKKAKLPYFVDYEYLKKELFVDSSIADDLEQDVIKMQWIEGVSIKNYLLHHRNDKNLLAMLAQQFLQMCKDLRVNHISHGDFQHDNIIIDTAGNIKLIDYDSLYVSALGQVQDMIEGFKNYQHPARSNNQFASEKLDFFSELVIYSSIKLIEEDPSVIEEVGLNDNTDGLLFTVDDFRNFAMSSIAERMKRLGGVFVLLRKLFEEYLSHDDIHELKPFDERFAELNAKPQIKSFKCSPTSSVYKGLSVFFSWKVINSSFVYINGELVDAEGQKEFVVDRNKTVKIEAINGLRSTSKSIELTALPEPVLHLSIDKNKLKKDKNDQATLTWNTHHAHGVVVRDEHGVILATDKKGSVSVSPIQTTSYTLCVVGFDEKKEFFEKVLVEVIPECVIEFHADKLFTLPSVPVVLDWLVKYADNIELLGAGLDDTHIASEGSLSIQPKNHTELTLRATDCFGIKEEYIEIQMLPLPQISSLMAKAPLIKNTVHVGVELHPMTAQISLPKSPELFEIPFVPTMSLSNKDINIKFADPPQIPNVNVEIGKVPMFSSWMSLTNLTNKLFDKLKQKLETKI